MGIDRLFVSVPICVVLDLARYWGLERVPMHGEFWRTKSIGASPCKLLRASAIYVFDSIVFFVVSFLLEKVCVVVYAVVCSILHIPQNFRILVLHLMISLALVLVELSKDLTTEKLSSNVHGADIAAALRIKALLGY